MADLTQRTPYNIDNYNFWMAHALNTIKKNFGHKVSTWNKGKDLFKYGYSDAVDNATRTTIMTLAGSELNETYVSSNIIDTISSSSGSDTEVLVVEGHTVDGSGNFTFVSQSATLAGQSKVVLTTPLARMTRLYNNGSNNLVGTIYGYEDGTITAGVPNTASTVHCMIRAGLNQSEKASTTVSQYDYWIITGAYASVLNKTGSPIVDVDIEVRLKGKVFRKSLDLGVSNAGGQFETFTPYLIIPPNSDIRLTALSSAASTDVSAGLFGTLGVITT